MDDDEGWKPESPSLAINPPKLDRAVKFPKFRQPPPLKTVPVAPPFNLVGFGRVVGPVEIAKARKLLFMTRNYKST